MFGFGKKHSNDEELARAFVIMVFTRGRELVPTIGECVQMCTDEGDVQPQMSENAGVEISLAILGTALAVLQGDSPIVDAGRGEQIASACRKSVTNVFHMPPFATQAVARTMDEYYEAYQNGLRSEPFREASELMLVKCMSGEVKNFFLISEVVGDIFIMTVARAVEFWKGK